MQINKGEITANLINSNTPKSPMNKKVENPDEDAKGDRIIDIKKSMLDARKEDPEAFKIEEDTKYKPINVATISGKLICKKNAVGTLSEGVIYFILPNDSYKTKYDEVLVRKKTQLWQDDPQLHPFVDKMVKIKGDIIETKSTITVDCIEIEEV